MRFLLDENFPCSIAAVLRDCGHEAVPFEEARPRGADDELVFLAAQRLGTVPLQHPTHCGIIVVALRQPSRAAIAERLRWFLANNTEPLANRAAILRDFSYRIR